MLDLTDWQNKKYTTRDGRPVRILCVDMKNNFYQIVGLVYRYGGEEIETWTIKGSYVFSGNYNMERDLINAKTKREGWVNVYPENEIGTLKKCKEDADADLFAKHRVACVHIEWEE